MPEADPLVTDDAPRIFDDGSLAAVAEPPEGEKHHRRPARPSWGSEILSRYALIVVWVAMAGYFAVRMPDTFLTHGSFSSIFGSQQVLVFLAMSVMVTLVVGEFDLSVASVMGLSATIVPVMAGVHGWNIWVACLAGLGAAMLAGVVNAFFVVILDVSSFVVTLGMGTLLIGISQWISNQTIVSVNDPSLSKLSIYPIFGMPVSFYYGIALALVVAYILAFTPLGRSMIFVGANREVARLAGIRVQRIRFGAYIFGALLSGLAGVILVATLGGADSSTTMAYLLPALAAVFLGTAVVHPGSFNPIGTMVAIYFLQTGIFGLQLLGAKGWITNVFYGAGLVIAVAVAKLVRDRSTRA
ncbi:ABC transporter permease [Nocardioides sp. cx-173]|uniref:ABC transporter permease n=1 Tax=Nocardioides sp. cx-173 TaxID=2898796 RepID=UPI001E2DFFED|nr:ABC transporter permease [Nocardioides sp. cx-173]MCD4526618.1 ABC transporter permease [Nocardioides sp. cx-173]UGB40711.1 ABC transporter permease [Nocardioides sp. cx-173]